MLSLAIDISLWLIGASIVMTFARLVRGPDAVNRVLAIDTLTVNTIALILILGIVRSSTLYAESALILAMVGFVGTVALAKYLIGRGVVE